MAYTALERFPDFHEQNLPTLEVSAIAEPTLEKARKRARVYLEARSVRPRRAGGDLTPTVPVAGNLPRKPVGAYADLRRSAIYPRLSAAVEVEILSIPAGWMLNVQARHGNQESIGGSFTFGSYPECCLRLGAWVWFSFDWIGDSWCGPSEEHRRKIHSVEQLNLRTLSLNSPARILMPFAAGRILNEKEVVVRLLRLMRGEETIDEEQDGEIDTQSSGLRAEI